MNSSLALLSLWKYMMLFLWSERGLTKSDLWNRLFLLSAGKKILQNTWHEQENVNLIYFNVEAAKVWEHKVLVNCCIYWSEKMALWWDRRLKQPFGCLVNIRWFSYRKAYGTTQPLVVVQGKASNRLLSDCNLSQTSLVIEYSSSLRQHKTFWSSHIW